MGLAFSILPELNMHLFIRRLGGKLARQLNDIGDIGVPQIVNTPVDVPEWFRIVRVANRANSLRYIVCYCSAIIIYYTN